MRPRVRILSVPRKAKTVRSAGDPPRGSSATTGGGTDDEFVRLVLVHFGDLLESALRDAYEEVIGAPLPPLFTIELQSHPQRAAGSSPPRISTRGRGRPRTPRSKSLGR